MGTPIFTGDVFQWARFCNGLGPFWSVFGELALFWCSTAKRKKRGKYILWLRKSQENFLVQWLIHILKTVHLQRLKRMPRSELTRHAKGIPFVNENVWKEYPFLSKKVVWLSWYRPLAQRGHVTNASFKQWAGILLMPKIDRAHKNNLTLNLKGNSFKGDILWHFDFSTK